jgi:hypothetical protein
MESQAYTERSNCVRAARRKFGPNAKQGEDFVLVPRDGKFVFVAVEEQQQHEAAPAPMDLGDKGESIDVPAPLPSGAVIDEAGVARPPEPHALAHLAGEIGMAKTYRLAEQAALKALGNDKRVDADFSLTRTCRGDYVWKSRTYERAREELELKKRTTKAADENARTKAGAKVPGQPRVRAAYAEALAAAARGVMPKAPDFSAATHERFRPKLAELKALAKAGDVKALKAYPIKPISTSPKAMDRYRNLCVMALEAQAEATKAAKH